MKTALLGIDVGTSACKVAAFDLEGRVLAQAAESYPVLYPQPGWAEQDPQQWWEAVCKALRRLWESGAVAPGEVAGVGIDGQSWSAIPLDKEGRALCNTPIWMDTRAGSLCQELEARVGGEKIFACSGNPLSASYTLPKVLWYKEHLPQVYEKAEKVLQSNGYLAFRLTGAVTQDKSQGYGWACYNVARNQWDIPLCQELGVKPSLLPEIVSCSQVVGGVTPQAAQETGLLEGTPVVAGGLDAACGTLGAGVIHPGETQEQGGQAGGMSLCVDSAQARGGGPVASPRGHGGGRRRPELVRAGVRRRRARRSPGAGRQLLPAAGPGGGSRSPRLPGVGVPALPGRGAQPPVGHPRQGRVLRH